MIRNPVQLLLRDLCGSRSAPKALTQPLVAAALGVATVTVERWAGGRGFPGDPEHLRKLRLLHSQHNTLLSAFPFLLTDCDPEDTAADPHLWVQACHFRTDPPPSHPSPHPIDEIHCTLDLRIPMRSVTLMARKTGDLLSHSGQPPQRRTLRFDLPDRDRHHVFFTLYPDR